MVAAVPGERHDLVVVDPPLDHRVDLDRAEACLFRGLDPVEHALEFVAARHLEEAPAIECVEADVDPREARAAQRLGDRAQRCPVRRHRQVDRTGGSLETCQLLDQYREMCSHGRFTTGEADAGYPVALDEDPGESLDLLERHHLRARQPLHPLLGHAIGAAEVASVGHRDPQIADHPPERVDQIGPPLARHGLLGHDPSLLSIVTFIHTLNDRRAGGGPPPRNRRRSRRRRAPPPARPPPRSPPVGDCPEP